MRDQELEAIKARVREMEEEAAKLKQIHEGITQQIEMNPSQEYGGCFSIYRIDTIAIVFFFSIHHFLFCCSLFVIQSEKICPPKKRLRWTTDPFTLAMYAIKF